MHDSEEESIECDLDVSDAEDFFYSDIDAGEGVYRYGVDKAGQNIDSDNNKAVS